MYDKVDLTGLRAKDEESKRLLQKYPEHGKFLLHRGEGAVLARFLMSLPEGGFSITHTHEDGESHPMPLDEAGIGALLNGYFGINEETFDRETREIEAEVQTNENENHDPELRSEEQTS